VLHTAATRTGRPVPVECRLQRERTVAGRESDRERAQRVVCQLTLGAGQLGVGPRTAGGREQVVEQHEVGGIALLVAPLLEERPRELVLRLLGESGLRPAASTAA